MKIVSVLTYPYENCFVIQITRATGQFDYPQVSKRYRVELSSPLVNSMTYWVCKLQSLHQSEQIKRLVDNYNRKKKDGSQN